jgi:hypothetical protein
MRAARSQDVVPEDQPRLILHEEAPEHVKYGSDPKPIDIKFYTAETGGTRAA